MRLSSVIVLVAFTYFVSAARVGGYNRRSNSVWRREVSTSQSDGYSQSRPGSGQQDPYTNSNTSAGSGKSEVINKAASGQPRLNRRGRGAFDTTGVKKPGVPPPPPKNKPDYSELKKLDRRGRRYDTSVIKKREVEAQDFLY